MHNRHFLTLSIIWVILIACAGFACEPEPGPQHFPRPEFPPPPAIKAGIFEVHNELNGLPSNHILAVAMLKKCVLAGSEDKGLLIYDGDSWKAFNASINRNFPVDTVSCLYRVSDTSALAGTPGGIFEIKIDENPHAPVISLLPMLPGQDLQNVIDIGMANDSPEILTIAGDRVSGELTNGSFIPFSWPGNLTPTGFNTVLVSKEKAYLGCSLGLFASVGKSLVQVSLSSDPGWVTDIIDFEKEVYITGSNGAFKIGETGDVESLLPGIWCECVGISGKPSSAGGNFEFDDMIGKLEGSLANFEKTENQRKDALAKFSKLREQLEVAITKINDSGNYSPDTELWKGYSDVLNKILDLMPDADAAIIKFPLKKGLWVGTQGSGLILFAKDGKNYRLTTDNSKLPSDNLSAISVSPAGEGWFATKDAGLMHYVQRKRPDPGDLDMLLKCSPAKIRVFGNQLLVGTRTQGLFAFNANTLKRDFHLEDSPDFEFHNCVNDFKLDAQGRLWVVGDKGVFCHSDGKWNKIRMLEQKSVETTPTNIEIDSNGKVFVAFSSALELSKQIYFYNGDTLENLDKQKLAEILQLPEKNRKAMMEFFGLKGAYQREFDFQLASETIKSFDQCVISPVSAILNIPDYLLIGTESGIQAIFDGEKFKQLSEKGTGNPGKIINLRRLPENHILIQGETGLSIFDGEHYHPIPAPSNEKMTDLVEDSENSQTFWVSYTNNEKGGIAVYSDTYWESTALPIKITSLAITSGYFFLASPDGVHYLPRRK